MSLEQTQFLSSTQQYPSPWWFSNSNCPILEPIIFTRPQSYFSPSETSSSNFEFTVPLHPAMCEGIRHTRNVGRKYIRMKKPTKRDKNILNHFIFLVWRHETVERKRHSLRMALIKLRVLSKYLILLSCLFNLLNIVVVTIFNSVII